MWREEEIRKELINISLARQGSSVSDVSSDASWPNSSATASLYHSWFVLHQKIFFSSSTSKDGSCHERKTSSRRRRGNLWYFLMLFKKRRKRKARKISLSFQGKWFFHFFFFFPRLGENYYEKGKISFHLRNTPREFDVTPLTLSLFLSLA